MAARRHFFVNCTIDLRIANYEQPSNGEKSPGADSNASLKLPNRHAELRPGASIQLGPTPEQNHSLLPSLSRKLPTSASP